MIMRRAPGTRLQVSLIISISLFAMGLLGPAAPAEAAYGRVDVSPAYLGNCNNPAHPIVYNTFELTGFLTGPVAQNPLCVIWQTSLSQSQAQTPFQFCQVQYGTGHGAQPQQNHADCVDWYRLPARLGVYYSFKIQGCNFAGLGTDCTGWTEVDYQCCAGVAYLTGVLTTPSPVPSPTRNTTGACSQGYVWRQANPADHVCVTPQARQQTADDNAAAAARTDQAPIERGSGPRLCLTGFVWRMAYAEDYVCVTPQARSIAAAQNPAAASHTAP